MKQYAKTRFLFGVLSSIFISKLSFGLEYFYATDNFVQETQQVRTRGNALQYGLFDVFEHTESINDGHFVMDWVAGFKNFMLAQDVMSEVIKVDEHFGQVLHKNDYNYVAATKQAYLLKNVQPEHFGDGTEIFRDPEYQNLVLNGVDHYFKDESWYTIKYIPWLARALCSHFVGVNTHVKVNKKDLSLNAIKMFKSTKLGVPDRVGVTYSQQYYFLGEEKQPNWNYPHDKVKASNSISLYYSVNKNKDVLVVTYQLVLANAPSYMKSDWMSKFVGMFTSGTKKSIDGTRKYFDNKLKK